MIGSSWLLFAIAPAFVSASAPYTEYLDDNCGNTLQISTDVLLDFPHNQTLWHHMPPNYRCKVSVQTVDTSKRLQVRFRYLYTVPDTWCHFGSVIISEGGTYLTPSYGVCGPRTPNGTYQTQGDTVTIEFLNNSTESMSADFGLLLTAFSNPSNGHCQGHDFKCDNGLCIPNGAVCNGYNDCGDNSDDDLDCVALAAWIIAVITLSTLTFFLIFLCLIFRARRRYRRVTTTVREYPTVQGTVVSSTKGYQSI